MLDVVLIAAVVLFFAASVLLLAACERVVGREPVVSEEDRNGR
jgi:hypothetical protein